MVCFDTSPLIWAVQKVAAPGFESMLARTAQYVDALQKKRVKIGIPAPVLSEFLIGLPPEMRKAGLLGRFFRIYSFDAECAEIAARLQANTTKMQQIRKNFDVNRQSLKVDAMIVATAIACGAERIITHNRGQFEALANGEIPIEGVPELEAQGRFDFGN